jgi:UDP:flavonoid glycosyltransferase YjiC (YdhE family)
LTFPQSQGRPGQKRKVVAVFCMPEAGHYERLAPLISGLVRAGLSVQVFTHLRFRRQTEQAGGIFFDLFSKYPLEEADSESVPTPSRYVTFAAKYAEPIRRDVEKVHPALILHDTFSVIGRVVAGCLDLPRVNVCAGHNVAPAAYLAALPRDPRVKTSTKCLEAVKILRGSYGLNDASPFSYVSSISPQLNVYCEPPEFLDEEKRRPFEPLVFYGSLPSPGEGKKGEPRPNRSSFGKSVSDRLKIYVSFGTIVWRYYADTAIRALTILASAFAGLDKVAAVISLGRAGVQSGSRAALIRSHVSVRSYVDQWTILREADVFFTHHGLNSTHEAIFHRVPMVSYPFFWDQPELAELCRKLGLAIPLVERPQGIFGEEDVRAVLRRLADGREAMMVSLSRAREWEQAVIDGRPAVHQRIASLMS